MIDLNNKKIAIVGNAQYLFNRRYGREIDNHDVIIRMNRAAILYTNKYDYYTHGSKTDIWAMWRYDEYENVHHIVEPKYVIQMAYWEDSDAIHINYYEPTKLKKLIDISGCEVPSTGLMILDWVSYFDTSKVSVYGFDWKTTPTFTDPTRAIDKDMPHDFAKEKETCYNYFMKEKNYTFRF